MDTDSPIVYIKADIYVDITKDLHNLLINLLPRFDTSDYELERLLSR